MLGDLFSGAIGMPFDALGIEKYNLPIVGPGLFGNPAADAKVEAMERAKQATAQYRPEVLEARMNALRQALGAFAPAAQHLQQMYGTAPSLGAQNPFGPTGPTPPPASAPQGPPGGFFNDAAGVFKEASGVTPMAIQPALVADFFGGL